MTRLTPGEVHAFRAGDESTFRRVVDQYSPRLLAFARAYAADTDESYDLVQETWRGAYQKRRSFSGTGTLFGWLLAVCRTVCLSSTAKRASRAAALLDPADHMAVPPIDPARAVELAELRRSIMEAVLDLPAREREVVMMRLVEQRSTRETAMSLGCAEGTVKAALHHAAKKLQVTMEVWVK